MIEYMMTDTVYPSGAVLGSVTKWGVLIGVVIALVVIYKLVSKKK